MKFKGFTKKHLLEIYQQMALSRYLADKQLILLKEANGFFYIGGSGHEAAGMAASWALKPGFDSAYPYYRKKAF